MWESGGIFEIAEERESVSPGLPSRSRGCRSLPLEAGGDRVEERYTRNREEDSACDEHVNFP